MSTAFCDLCGVRFRAFGKHPARPQPGDCGGYYLCAECAQEWREGGRLQFLTEGGKPRELFRLDKATVELPNAVHRGPLIFFDKAVVFLPESTETEADQGRAISIGAMLGGAVGAVVAAGLASTFHEKKTTTFPATFPGWRSRADSVEEALRRAHFLLVMKRKDIKSVGFRWWANGFYIKMPSIKYTAIQVSKKAYEQHRQRIDRYLAGQEQSDQRATRISVQCPGCKSRLKVRQEMAGRKVKCPKCGTVVEVPSAE